MELNRLRDRAFLNSLRHGFYGPHDGDLVEDIDKMRASINVGEKIALMHSELSEVLEEARKGLPPDAVYYLDGAGRKMLLPAEYFDKPEGVPIELADCMIRILDFCGAFQIDIEKAIEMKMKYNESRPYKHGKKF